jgi:hypothetical protein
VWPQRAARKVTAYNPDSAWELAGAASSSLDPGSTVSMKYRDRSS